MCRVLIFDLDDTLYPERSFVESGFRAVSVWLEAEYAWPAKESLRCMTWFLSNFGRDHIFDRLLSRYGVTSRRAVSSCISVYRTHKPSIVFYREAKRLLNHLKLKPYLVTDGNKTVQRNKIEALGLRERCSKIYLTHCYGVQNEKPSTRCFELIREREKCEWSDMLYVGDDPAKDFVGLTPLGVTTVRVRTGRYAADVAKPGYEAKYVIRDLSQFVDKLPTLC